MTTLFDKDKARTKPCPFCHEPIILARVGSDHVPLDPTQPVYRYFEDGSAVREDPTSRKMPVYAGHKDRCQAISNVEAHHRIKKLEAELAAGLAAPAPAPEPDPEPEAPICQTEPDPDAWSHDEDPLEPCDCGHQITDHDQYGCEFMGCPCERTRP